MGWLIDPEERLILVFSPGREPTEFVGAERLPIPDFLQLELTVEGVFSWLKF